MKMSSSEIIISIEFNEPYDDASISHGDYKFGPLPIIDYTVSYDCFYRRFMSKNKPCIIRNVSKLWMCSTNWITGDTLNFDYLSKEYKDLSAPVANCNSTNFNSHCKKNMNVNEYMNYLKNDDKKDLLYLKDWHLKQARPEDNFYYVPHIFASDWLNEWAQDKNEDDFMFVYIGPNGSWTPIHVDVYNSFSWSVNVIGRKKWIFFPPGEENKLKDSLGNLPLLFKGQSSKNVVFHEIIQERGDAIFVPSGWHHQVENLLDTISINHNWINGCNLQAVWKALQESLNNVEHEIEEYKDTPEYAIQCQTILKCLFGMNYESFITFICYIAEKRLSQLKGHHYLLFQKYTLGRNHTIFDLKVIHSVINDMINRQNFFENYLLLHLESLVLNIRKAIIQNICEKHH